MADEQRQRLLVLHRPALFVHENHPVAVAVEGRAEARARLDHLFAQRAQLVVLGGVRRAVGERAVEFAEQLGYAIARAAKRRGSQPAHRAVARVDHRAQGPARAEALEQRGLVGRLQVDLRHAALPRGEGAPLDDLGQMLNLPPGDGLLAQHELHAVVLRRIVRGGDGRARVRLAAGEGVIQQRRGNQSQILRLCAALAQAAQQRLLPRGRRTGARRRRRARCRRRESSSPAPGRCCTRRRRSAPRRRRRGCRSP